MKNWKLKFTREITGTEVVEAVVEAASRQSAEEAYAIGAFDRFLVVSRSLETSADNELLTIDEIK